MDLAAVMDQLSERLDTIAGLRCFAWPGGAVTPPAAIVTYPTDYTFDATYGRGMDKLNIPIVVLVGNPTQRTARDAMGQYVNGSGASSVKAVLESGTYTAFDSIRVASVDFDVYEEAGGKYLAAIFDCEIAGQGA